MAKAEDFFMDNITRLPMGPTGPLDPEKHNLYWGLVNLSREVAAARQENAEVLRLLRQIAARLP